MQKHVENLIFLVLVGIVCFLIIASCWYYCSDYNRNGGDNGELDMYGFTDRDASGVRRLVIAQEIRPGLMLVHGNQEEIHKIVCHYDAVRRQETSQQYGACATSDVSSPFTQTQYQTRPSAPTDAALGSYNVNDFHRGVLASPPPYEAVPQPTPRR